MTGARRSIMTQSNVVNFDEEPRESPLNGSELAIRRVADQMHRLNHAIVQAVEAGVTIELLRCSRFHSGGGAWGDQMQPIVTIRETGK
jgi:hypothetical protein